MAGWKSLTTARAICHDIGKIRAKQLHNLTVGFDLLNGFVNIFMYAIQSYFQTQNIPPRYAAEITLLKNPNHAQLIMRFYMPLFSS